MVILRELSFSERRLLEASRPTISHSTKRLIETSSPQISYAERRLIETADKNPEETLTRLEERGFYTGREEFVDNYLTKK